MVAIATFILGTILNTSIKVVLKQIVLGYILYSQYSPVISIQYSLPMI